MPADDARSESFFAEKATTEGRVACALSMPLKAILPEEQLLGSGANSRQKLNGYKKEKALTKEGFSEQPQKGLLKLSLVSLLLVAARVSSWNRSR
jgi:hypothetical protein